MPDFQRAILTHGGAGSDPKDFYGPKSVAIRGMDLMVDGGTALTAAVDAVKYLEDTPRINAGSGSKLRIDGRTMQLDSSCMTGNKEFGAVACVENSMSPDDAAHKAIHLFDPRVDIGLIILTRNGFASDARNGMPWSHMTESKHQ